MSTRLLLTLALVVLPLVAYAEKPGAADLKPATNVLAALVAIGEIDADTRARLLFHGCSEIASCANGCERALSASANHDVDASQRGQILASCAGLDYKKCRDKDGKLTAEAWIDQHMRAFFNAIRPLVPKADRPEFDAARTKAKL
jgi:hypothetical protein